MGCHPSPCGVGSQGITWGVPAGLPDLGQAAGDGGMVRRGRPERGGLGILLCYRDARGRVRMPVLEPLMGAFLVLGAGILPRDSGGPSVALGTFSWPCPVGCCRTCLLLVDLPGLLLFAFSRETKFLLGTRFFIFARDEFLSGVLLIFGGCGRSYPVMVCHPSPVRVAPGGRSLGGFAGLADLLQVALHGSVGYSEYLCYFWHSVAELDHQFDGLSSAGVVVVGIVGVPASVDACGLDVTECSFAELAQAVPGTGLGDGTALGVGQRGARRVLGCSAAGRGRATGRCVLMEDGSRPVRSVGEFHAEAEQIYNGAFVSVP